MMSKRNQQHDEPGPLDPELDIPEGFHIEPVVWMRLSDLHAIKVSSERMIKDRQKALVEVERALAQLTREIVTADRAILQQRAARTDLQTRIYRLALDPHVVLRMKMGQVRDISDDFYSSSWLFSACLRG